MSEPFVAFVSFVVRVAFWHGTIWDGLIARMLHGPEEERALLASWVLLLDVDPSNFLKHDSLVTGLQRFA